MLLLKSLQYICQSVIFFIKHTPPILNIRLINHRRLYRRRLSKKFNIYHQLSNNYIYIINNKINDFDKLFENKSIHFYKELQLLQLYINNIFIQYTNEINQDYMYIINDIDRCYINICLLKEDNKENVIKYSNYINDNYDKLFDNYNRKNYNNILYHFSCTFNKIIDNENIYLINQIDKLEDLNILCNAQIDILQKEKKQLNNLINKCNNKFNIRFKKMITNNNLQLIKLNESKYQLITVN